MRNEGNVTGNPVVAAENSSERVSYNLVKSTLHGQYLVNDVHYTEIDAIEEIFVHDRDYYARNLVFHSDAPYFTFYA